MQTYFPELGKAIRKRREEKRIVLIKGDKYPSLFLVTVANRLGKKPWATYEAINLIEKGDIYGTTSEKGIRLNRERHLHELSIYLHMLSYSESDEEIGTIRQIDPEFVYPPQRLQD